jgi:hypothetical protein
MIALFLGHHHCWFDILVNITAVKRHGCFILQVAVTSLVIA